MGRSDEGQQIHLTKSQLGAAVAVFKHLRKAGDGETSTRVPACGVIGCELCPTELTVESIYDKVARSIPLCHPDQTLLEGTEERLLPHQRDAIDALRGMEESPYSPLQESFCFEWDGGRWEIDTFHGTMTVVDHLRPPVDDWRVSLRGGINAGEVGTGKTLIQLGLILEDARRRYTGPVRTVQKPARRGRISDRRKVVSEVLFTKTDGALVIVPDDLVAAWQQQLRDFAPSLRAGLVTLKEADINRPVFVEMTEDSEWEHARLPTSARLTEFDMVLTTYSMAKRTMEDVKVLAESRRDPNVRLAEELSLLLQMDWRRVVVDEGHLLQNDRTHVNTFVESLHAEAVSLMSGTILTGDSPHKCASRFKHPLRLLLATRDPQQAEQMSKRWEAVCVAPMREGRLYGFMNFQHALSRVLVRHRRADVLRGVPLPIERECPLTFRPREAYAYSQMAVYTIRCILIFRVPTKETNCVLSMVASNAMRTVKDMKDACTHQADIAFILGITPNADFYTQDRNDIRAAKTDWHKTLRNYRLIRENSPYEVRAYTDTVVIDEYENRVASYAPERREVRRCCICGADSFLPTFMPCSHLYCMPCLRDKVFGGTWDPKDTRVETCAIPGCGVQACPRELEPLNFLGRRKACPDLADVDTPKIRFLHNELVRLKRQNPKAKVVVYTVDKHLAEFIQDSFLSVCPGQYHFLALSKETKRKNRRDILRDFMLQDHDLPTVLLVNRLSACGLNLVAGEELFIMEPIDSAEVRAQLIGRLYRHGQTQAVRIHELYVRGTIEDTIINVAKDARESRIGRAMEEGRQEAATQRTNRRLTTLIKSIKPFELHNEDGTPMDIPSTLGTFDTQPREVPTLMQLCCNAIWRRGGSLDTVPEDCRLAFDRNIAVELERASTLRPPSWGPAPPVPAPGAFPPGTVEGLTPTERDITPAQLAAFRRYKATRAHAREVIDMDENGVFGPQRDEAATSEDTHGGLGESLPRPSGGVGERRSAYGPVAPAKRARTAAWLQRPDWYLVEEDEGGSDGVVERDDLDFKVESPQENDGDSVVEMETEIRREAALAWDERPQVGEWSNAMLLPDCDVPNGDAWNTAVPVPDDDEGDPCDEKNAVPLVLHEDQHAETKPLLSRGACAVKSDHGSAYSIDRIPLPHSSGFVDLTEDSADPVAPSPAGSEGGMRDLIAPRAMHRPRPQQADQDHASFMSPIRSAADQGQGLPSPITPESVASLKHRPRLRAQPAALGAEAGPPRYARRVSFADVDDFEAEGGDVKKRKRSDPDENDRPAKRQRTELGADNSSPWSNIWSTGDDRPGSTGSPETARVAATVLGPEKASAMTGGNGSATEMFRCSAGGCYYSSLRREKLQRHIVKCHLPPELSRAFS